MKEDQLEEGAAAPWTKKPRQTEQLRNATGTAHVGDLASALCVRGLCWSNVFANNENKAKTHWTKTSEGLKSSRKNTKNAMDIYVLSSHETGLSPVPQTASSLSEVCPLQVRSAGTHQKRHRIPLHFFFFWERDD